MRKHAFLVIVGLLLCAAPLLTAAAKKAEQTVAPAAIRADASDRNHTAKKLHSTKSPATTRGSVTETTGDVAVSPAKIHLVWQHDNLPSVDLSTLPKVTGVNVVSPCWYVISNEYGRITSKAVEGYTARARSKGYQVWPLITNGFDPDRTKKLLQDHNARRYVINQLLSEAEKHGFQGINLDFENIYQEDKEALTQFVAEIRKATKKKHLILSMDVTVPDGSPNWSLCFDRKNLAKQVDYLLLMAYDQYSGGSPMAGPTASFNWDEAGVTATLQEVPADKLVLGLPLYMRLWQFDTKAKRFRAKTLSMSQAAGIHKEKSTDPTYRCRWLEKEKMLYVSYMEQDVPYCFWQENAQSLRNKAELVNRFGLAGIAAWRYGFETPDIWPVLEEVLQQEKAPAPKTTT